MRRLKGLEIGVLVMGIIVGLVAVTLTSNSYFTVSKKQVNQPVKEEEKPQEILQQARQLYYQGDYSKSINKYQQLLESAKSEQALNNLAAIYEELGDYQAAAEQYQRLLEIKEAPQFKLGLGISYYNLGNLEEAEEVLVEVTDEGVQAKDYILKEANYYLGLITGERKRYQEADDYLEQSLQYRDFALGHYQLGEVDFARGEYKEARGHYLKALQTDGSLTGVNYKLGLTYLELNQIGEAVNYLKKAKREGSRLTVVNQKLAKLEKEYPEYFKDRSDDEKLPEDRKIPKEADFRTIKHLPHPGPRMRIGIMEEKREIRFRVGSSFMVKEGEEVIARGDQGELVTVLFNGGLSQLKLADQTLHFTGPIIIVPEAYVPIEMYNVGYGAGYYWAGREHRQYRGLLELRPGFEGITAVNLVRLEEYLLSVVPSEMSASWPIEALKVQAVAARSYTLSNLGKHGRDGYDLCSTVHCAAYRGINREASKVRKAVAETAGQVMIHNGHPINAVYSANSGGHTENSEDVWSAEVPYLRGVSTELDRSSFPLAPGELKEWLKEVPPSYSREQKYTKLSHYRWQRSVSVEYLETRLGIKNIKQLKPLERGEAGSVKSVLVVGENEQKEIRSSLRSRLGGLRSNRFWIQPRYQDGEVVNFLFYGSGWGHSVGMDQVAVAAMADHGREYRDILLHFYSGVQIEDWY